MHAIAQHAGVMPYLILRNLFVMLTELQQLTLSYSVKPSFQKCMQNETSHLVEEADILFSNLPKYFL